MKATIWNLPLAETMAAMVCASMLLSACAQSQASRHATNSSDDADPLGDFFSITGEVEFEGQRIVYDEMIEIRTKHGTSSDMGQVRGNNHTMVSRLWITRTLKNSDALTMEVPNAFGLWTDLKGHEKLDPRFWPPERIATEQRPPETILPEFYWVNDLKKPTMIEAYVSESYFEQPSARLKIIRPIRLDFVPPSAAADQKAIAQMNAEPRLDLSKGRPAGSFSWKAIALFPMGRQDWSQFPEIRAAIETSGKVEAIVLDRKMSEPLLSYGVQKLHWGDAASERYGVAQPKKYPKSEGMIGLQWRGHYADAAIPTSCSIELKLCKALMDRHGYYILYDSFYINGGITLDILDARMKVQAGEAIYIPATDTVYFIYGRIIW